MKKYQKLQRLNTYAAMLHGVQALVILLLANNSARDITTSYFGFNETTETLFATSRTLFSIEIAYLVAAFFFMSSLAHTYVAVVNNKQYNADLKKGINRARWFEYAASASTMMVIIAMLSGIFDLGSLLGIFALTATMNMMGLVMEVYNRGAKKINWLGYNIGVFAGIIPWLVVALAFWASSSASDSAGGPPTFVYVIFVTIFLLFNTFAVNMILQYKKVSKWRDYLYGERIYIVLSLVAKTLLAWQVYFGALQPVG